MSIKSNKSKVSIDLVPQDKNAFEQNQRQQLADIVNIMNTQKQQKEERLITTIQNNPLDAKALAEIEKMTSWESLKFFVHHPGYHFDDIIASLNGFLDVFHLAFSDFSKAIDMFANFLKDEEHSHPSKQKRLTKIENIVRKEVFTFSCAASSLVGVSRRISKHIKIDEYQTKIKSSFDVKEQSFVTALRNCLTHGSFVGADWQIQYDNNEQTGTFTLDSKLLLYNKEKITKEAIQYIEEAGDSIDLRCLLISYHEKVKSFYSWVLIEIEKNTPDYVVAYRTCIKNQKIFAVQSMWYVLLKQVVIPNKINPFDHLHKYLTKEQIAKVMLLEKGSKEQVDAIISMVDVEGACDAGLRALAYTAFNVQTDSD